ncbi:MAG: Tm-1-like ATP-binding domain-containing protein [Desulfobacterales bacterium]|nr:MAG: Tm-1-like ATP-binding domain-containing protein [Desulfobacterales bacterium]
MNPKSAIAVVGTFDSKAEEHFFLRDRIEHRGLQVLTINVGTKGPSPFPVSIDLYEFMYKMGKLNFESRDESINAMIQEAKTQIKKLYHEGEICGIISAGGGTGTHLGTGIMHELPLGVPKVMVSTVASRDMRSTVGTKDITMIHSVADLLGVNSISGKILEIAAAGICGMVRTDWKPKAEKKRIALPFFGFITEGAEATKNALEALGYEVVAFHANGTGGMAMEELAAEGYFDGILDFATHELADDLKNGYCRGIGPERFEPVPDRSIPRLIVPGGLDCAVLEFTRRNVPEPYKDRKIFFYDFRSAIRLNIEETKILADQLSQKLNQDPANIKVLIPTKGWSEADRHGGPLYDPEMNRLFTQRLKEKLDSQIEIEEMDCHINDTAFGEMAAKVMDEMVRNVTNGEIP